MSEELVRKHFCMPMCENPPCEGSCLERFDFEAIAAAARAFVAEDRPALSEEQIREAWVEWWTDHMQFTDGCEEWSQEDWSTRFALHLQSLQPSGTECGMDSGDPNCPSAVDYDREYEAMKDCQPEGEKCERCHGDGHCICSCCDGDGDHDDGKDCYQCNGEGVMDCPDCNGTGQRQRGEGKTE